MVWIEFVTCSALLTFFAYHLCREGVVLSKKTRIAEGIIGIVFLAIATSFPEIVTAGVSVFFLDKIGLGYGDIIGSVIINLMILIGLDYYVGRGRILLKISGINRFTGSFILFLLLIILGGAALRLSGVAIPAFGRIGAENLLVIFAYLASLQIIRKKGQEDSSKLNNDTKEKFLPVWAKFIIFLAVVMCLGVWMAKIGEKIVARTNLSQTFTGTLLLGFATSLPEIIVSFAALSAGSANMAVGNILGSNLFDVCIIPFLDMLTKRPILGLLTTGQVLATAIVFILSMVLVSSFLLKKETRRRINWDTGIIFAIGFLGFVILYYAK